MLVAKSARNHALKSKVHLKIHTKLATPTLGGWVMPTLLTREHERRYEGFCSPGDGDRLQFFSSPLPSLGSYALPVFVLCFLSCAYFPIHRSGRKYAFISKDALKSQMRLKTRIYGTRVMLSKLLSHVATNISAIF